MMGFYGQGLGMLYREGNLVFKSRQEGGQNILLHCERDAIGEVVIPSGVSKIEAGAFQDCKAVTSIRFPESVTEIEDRAFAGSGIMSLNLPRLERIKFRLCAGCKALKSVRVQEGLIAIDSSAFEQCEVLESLGVNADTEGLELPIGFEELGESAFRSCFNLKIAKLPQTVTAINYAAFCYSGLKIIYYPQNAIVGYHAFNQCKNLHQVVLPQVPMQSMGL
ncbi:leucine-rich repeat domain-containing protein [Candidatus Synchoanobacter obligatus]|uniref:Leucine-rich repeat domain-containing protein n=1 Tax=Candidatus Synchoanobacter obligatus TaxID=2919597 RepID=A0ABT1L645_9GAMM|nr:leucine-rich repeat domain-containing protein [Candidatus Synchoanobacter obligatus]MCP8352646.1 leucine-rich repeat domain-containing protein [Candidatus Synchoanobacter obligatus]